LDGASRVDRFKRRRILHRLTLKNLLSLHKGARSQGLRTFFPAGITSSFLKDVHQPIAIAERHSMQCFRSWPQ
jgi:hypothetical protein